MNHENTKINPDTLHSIFILINKNNNQLVQNSNTLFSHYII
jgi:hypothetical protein